MTSTFSFVVFFKETKGNQCSEVNCYKVTLTCFNNKPFVVYIPYFTCNCD